MTIWILTIPVRHSEPMEAKEIEPDLATMQALVGGYLEAVELVLPGGTMYVNEEGKLERQYGGLSFNFRATALLQRHNPLFGSFIVGDAFVCGVPDEAGNDRDCDSAYLRMAEN